MNILIIPFHDWRKIIKEGFRTRDAHFIETLAKKGNAKKIIINRPITLLEILFKKKNKLIEGEIVYKKKGGFTLYKIQSNTYVIDYISKNILQQIIKKYRWYVNTYSNHNYLSFIEECLTILEVSEYCLLSQNVFAYKLSEKLKGNVKVFDAWDNFTKFKVYKEIQDEIEKGYTVYSKCSNFWITNAKENVFFFKEKFNPKEIHLVPNGVDLNRFITKEISNVPEDMANIKRPIAGFGGKITQLLDTGLINKFIEDTPNVSFVFVGQLLDKEVFNKIKKRPNFHYLGDKHYDTYPKYVKNFDICIVPYVTKEEQKSGANSIKVYEYLATGKKIIGTFGNGLENLKEYLYLVKNANDFSRELQQFENKKDKINLSDHSWKNRVDSLIEFIENEANN